MNIKFLPGTLHRGAQLTTLSGEVLAEFSKDNEFVQTELYSNPGLPLRVKITLDMVVGDAATIIDGSVASNALPEAPRALPTPRYALPDPEYVEARLDQLRRPFFCDEEQEWEGEEDFMEGLCPDCAQELCLQCGRCNTLHEKQRTAHVFEREGPSSHS